MSREVRPQRDRRPTLVFFSSSRSGPARRMSSLVAWVRVTEKTRLRVLEVDVDRDPVFADAMRIRTIPALVLVHERRELGRLEGRATGPQIEELIRPHVGTRQVR